MNNIYHLRLRRMSSINRALVEKTIEAIRSNPKRGLYHCTNCSNVEEAEREVICWRCGKGEMVWKESK